MRRVLNRSLFLGLFFLLFASSADAASLYIDPPRAELNRGDAVELSVRLDVDEAAGQCVNAVDAVLTYSENIEPVDVSIGDSIFSIWVEQPKIDKENRTISFAGGMPNGYCGRVTGDPRLTNNLVKLIFRAPGFTIGGNSAADNPEASVQFTEFTAAYLNDGFGTKLAPRTFGATMSISKTAGAGGIIDPWRETVGLDEIPPEEFSILLQKGDLEFAGEYYISFNTTDKQTGIDIYQVMEEPIDQLGNFAWGRADAPWVTTRSPYVLEDQTLNSVIRVRAIDKAGNEYVATLLPDESLRTKSGNQMTTVLVFGFVLLIILSCVGVIVAFVRERRKKKSAEEDEMMEDEELEEEEEELEDDEEEYEDDK